MKQRRGVTAWPKQMQELAPSWSLAKVVTAIQALRGVALIAAFVWAIAARALALHVESRDRKGIAQNQRVGVSVLVKH